MNRRRNRTPHGTRLRGTAAALVVALIATGCGDDDSGDGTVSRSAWVDQFDRICVAVAHELSPVESGMTEPEWTAFTIGAVTVLRALPFPDDGADTAHALLDDLLLGAQPGSTDDEMATIEQRIFENMTALGVSDECVGGAPG